jgi:hypothetical protein
VGRPRESPADAVDIACDAESILLFTILTCWELGHSRLRNSPLHQELEMNNIAATRETCLREQLCMFALLQIELTSEKVCEKRNKEFWGSEWLCQAS